VATSCARYSDSGYVFATERGTAFMPDAINRLVKIIGKRAGLSFPEHFHMLRHSCGYKLANDGIDTRAIQDWLGHVSITQHCAVHGVEPHSVQGFLARLSLPALRRHGLILALVSTKLPADYPCHACSLWQAWSFSDQRQAADFCDRWLVAADPLEGADPSQPQVVVGIGRNPLSGGS
jgi:hypothetical protein